VRDTANFELPKSIERFLAENIIEACSTSGRKMTTKDDYHENLKKFLVAVDIILQVHGPSQTTSKASTLGEDPMIEELDRLILSEALDRKEEEK